MIILAAFHKFSAISQVSYQLPILGIIALILAFFTCLILFLIFGVKSSVEWPELMYKIWFPSLMACWIMGGVLSIYGIVAGLAGLALFIIALSMVLIPIIIGIIMVIRLWAGFGYQTKGRWLAHKERSNHNKK